MQKTGKRKLRSPPSSATSVKESTKSTARAINGRNIACEEPFPTHVRPDPEECRSVRDDLLDLHGFPEQFAKYRRDRKMQKEHAGTESQTYLDVDDRDETVLDGLVKTVLSQNTTDVNCQRAFASLKLNFPTWEDVSIQS